MDAEGKYPRTSSSQPSAATWFVLHPVTRVALTQKLAVDNRSIRLYFTELQMRELAGKQE